MKNQPSISRRNFLTKASVLAISGPILSFTGAKGLVPDRTNPDKKLWDEFSQEEKLKTDKSDRAKKILEIESGSCAEKVLLSTIRSFGKPDELVSFAASFGGGMKKGDLCGMLTGGFMSIGFAADLLFDNKEESSEWVKAKTFEFWTWWEDQAPKDCRDLRPLYAHDDKAIHKERFNRMLQRVALQLDKMFIV